MISFYAVRIGRCPGVYLNWADCKAQVDGFSGAVYKKFPTLKEAQAFVQNAEPPAADTSAPKTNQASDARRLQPQRDITKNNPAAPISQNPNIGISAAQSSQPAFTDFSQSPDDAAHFTPAKELSDADRAELSDIPSGACTAYVDGSFHPQMQVFGYGALLLTKDGVYSFQGNGSDPELASMRNVSGEIHGSMRAVTEAMRMGASSVTIYYDYMGIECWARGTWKANKEGTKAYRDFMQKNSAFIQIRFRKVKAHTGVRFNELADRLAKQAVGLL